MISLRRVKGIIGGSPNIFWRITSIGLVATLALLPFQVFAMSSTNYRLDAYEINSFGGVGSSTSYKLVTSGGEPFVKEGSSTNYKVGAGFAYEISYGMKVGFYNNGIGIYDSSLPANVSLGNLQAGSPVTGVTDIRVMTDAPDAPKFNIAAHRVDSDTTMDAIINAANNISDKTAWNPSGNGNAVTWSGTGLGFTVFASTATKNTTWWGTGTTKDDANNKYAGFPTSAHTIMAQDFYTSGDTTTSVGYKLDVPPGQLPGDYDGIIVYTVTMAL